MVSEPDPFRHNATAHSRFYFSNPMLKHASVGRSSPPRQSPSPIYLVYDKLI